ncbi:cyclin-dependent kinase A-1-like isoform X2 [Mangifera indica]|uniref:cyclin-dependent kinase A-1-like isoform X2 n=1 Tax=Mangifera indica TaxID=29780 RepID=UPI001CF9EAFC|nr:cyclin-dependent kinase A-1-like isoform X2 [Mangifera indica]
MEKLKEWDYRVIKKIGEGGYGEVYRCRHRKTKETFAIKMITINNIVEGVPSQVIREIALLKELDHVNITRLLDVLTSGNYVYLVFEHLDLDLYTFINKRTTPMNTFMIKAIVKQILIGVAHCHAHKVLHRDIRPMNILIDLKRNIVKIADFGLSRGFDVPLKEFSFHETFSFYTAPELLLCSREYSTPIDVWAVGCIFGEMLLGKPLFPHNSSEDLLLGVRRFTGELQTATDPPAWHLNNLSKMLDTVPDLEPAGFDLLYGMLKYDPNERITINNAIRHEYLQDVEIVPLETAPPPRITRLLAAFHCPGLNTKAVKNKNVKDAEIVPLTTRLSAALQFTGIIRKSSKPPTSYTSPF